MQQPRGGRDDAPLEPDGDDSERVARRYDRIAWFYDAYNWPMEAGIGHMRQHLLGLAARRTLEIGVGTGRNLRHYPRDVELVGIDISPRMLARSRRRARKWRPDTQLELADIERLPYPDASFDTITATCVFCSVSDPVRGLGECARVVKRDGRVLLLEHVRPRNRFLARLADLVSPLTRRTCGFNLNRPTERNAEMAGLRIVDVRRRGIWREIVAVRDTGDAGR